MGQEYRERFPRHRLQRNLLVSNPGMHHGTCVTPVSWCMSRSATRCGGENVPGITSASATRKFMYFAKGLWCMRRVLQQHWPYHSMYYRDISHYTVITNQRVCELYVEFRNIHGVICHNVAASDETIISFSFPSANDVLKNSGCCIKIHKTDVGTPSNPRPL